MAEYDGPTADYGVPSAGYGVPASEYGAPVADNNAPAAEYGAPSADYGAPAAESSTISEPAESFNLLTLVLRQEVIYNLFLTLKFVYKFGIHLQFFCWHNLENEISMNFY